MKGHLCKYIHAALEFTYFPEGRSSTAVLFMGETQRRVETEEGQIVGGKAGVSCNVHSLYGLPPVLQHLSRGVKLSCRFLTVHVNSTRMAGLKDEK